MTIKVAFATCAKIPGLTDDDRLLIEPLKALSISVAAATWDDASINWKNFDAVVIRSTWDYVEKARPFMEWIEMLESQGVRVLNAPSVLRWNIEKTYLRELEAKGIDIVPTAWVDAGDLRGSLSKGFGEWMPDRQIDRLVLKPTVSAGGRKTYLLDASDTEGLQRAAANILEESSAMIQPFFEEVREHGELSFLFFNKNYSHAVQKIPAKGDFRAQFSHGATDLKASPSADWVNRAERIVHAIDSELLYARVDVIPYKDAFLLSELELLEPCLYLGVDPDSPRYFAKALVKLLSH